jgi:hypothetical protein
MIRMKISEKVAKDQREKVERQLRDADPVKLCEELSTSRAQDILLMARILIDQVGLEKAKELVYKARYDSAYKKGRKAAEAKGNPKDIDSIVDWYFLKQAATKDKPYVLKGKGFEVKTETKFVSEPLAICYLGEALVKYGDPETVQVAEARCCHDIAALNGFNPDIKVEWTKSYFHGDGCCQFALEKK